MALETKIEGVAIGILMGFDNGKPLVVYPQNPRDRAVQAESLVTIAEDVTGHQVALLFIDGDPARPLIIGPLLQQVMTATTEVIADGVEHKIEAEERLELRCGKASIILEKSGHLTIRGTDIVSQASGTNFMRGASVNLN